MAASRAGSKHFALYQALRALIESGAIKPGGLLPTEDELCAEHGVSRYTLREAVGMLERQGFVERRRRAGTRVLDRQLNPAFRQVTASSRALLQQPTATKVAFEPAKRIQTDGALARALGCDELREWWYLKGVRGYLGDPRPTAISEVYIDAVRTTVSPPPDLGGARPVVDWVSEASRIHVKGASQEIAAIALNAEQARKLNEKPGAPALRILRRYYDMEQKVFLISVTVNRSTDYTFAMRIDFES